MSEARPGGPRFHLTFPEHLIDEPVIHELGRRFDVVTNIRGANVDERFAWIILEIAGSEAQVADAVAWLAEKGITVERLGEG
ncbi:MAG: NIL domain-containing protein [Actinomycetota bacterium]